VTHLSNMNVQPMSSKYFADLNDQLDYAIEYATPIHQSWPSEHTGKLKIFLVTMFKFLLTIVIFVIFRLGR
jgi:hypothetical protein